MLLQMGTELREARERRGISIADVQAETKIRSRYLEALEQGRYDILPGDVYARGFLKSYASYLGLDAQSFADRLRQWQEEQSAAAAQSQAAAQARPKGAQPRAPKATATVAKVENAPHPEPASKPAQTAERAPQPAVGLRPGRNLWLGLGVLLVASVIVGAWLAYRNGAAAGGPPPSGQPVAGADASPDKGAGSSPSTPPVTPVNTDGAPVLVLEPGDMVDFQVPFTITGAGTGPLNLTVTANDACWVRVERSGLPTAEETLAPGTVKTWQFTGEVRIKLGNPPGASIKVNSTAVAPSASLEPVTYVFTVK